MPRTGFLNWTGRPFASFTPRTVPSTATGLLQNMEKLDYIYREVSEADSRLKRIVLTDKSIELHKRVILTFDNIESKLLTGFSDSEKEMLFGFLLRLEKNLEEGDL